MLEGTALTKVEDELMNFEQRIWSYTVDLLCKEPDLDLAVIFGMSLPSTLETLFIAVSFLLLLIVATSLLGGFRCVVTLSYLPD